LTLLEFAGNLLHVGLDGSIGGAGGMCVVAGTVLESSGNLKNGKKGDEHSHHACRLAKVGHFEKVVELFGVKKGPGGSAVKEWWLKYPENPRTIKSDAKERNDLGSSPEVCKKSVTVRNLDVKDTRDQKCGVGNRSRGGHTAGSYIETSYS
jgi:hypothetical protein